MLILEIIFAYSTPYGRVECTGLLNVFLKLTKHIKTLYSLAYPKNKVQKTVKGCCRQVYKNHPATAFYIFIRELSYSSTTQFLVSGRLPH